MGLQSSSRGTCADSFRAWTWVFHSVQGAGLPEYKSLAPALRQGHMCRLFPRLDAGLPLRAMRGSSRIPIPCPGLAPGAHVQTVSALGHGSSTPCKARVFQNTNPLPRLCAPFLHVEMGVQRFAGAV